MKLKLCPSQREMLLIEVSNSGGGLRRYYKYLIDNINSLFFILYGEVEGKKLIPDANNPCPFQEHGTPELM